jgi:hypothetical protein
MLFLQVLTIFLVSLAMALAVAHALELPGKMRLNRANYMTVQTIALHFGDSRGSDRTRGHARSLLDGYPPYE